jgi:hypothetical protein
MGRKATVLSLAIVASVGACHKHIHYPDPVQPPPIVCAGIVTTGPNVLAYAPAVIARALTGVRDRGEQDIMLQMEAKLPGFGAWFLVGDTFNIYMKDPSSTTPDRVRRLLIETYGSRTDSASVCRGAAAIASMGVPLDALELEVWGIIHVGPGITSVERKAH